MTIYCDNNQTYEDYTGLGTALLSLDSRFEKIPGAVVMGQISWKYTFHGTVEELSELLNPVSITPHVMTRQEYEALSSLMQAEIISTLQKALAHNTEKLVAFVYLSGPILFQGQKYEFIIKSGSTKHIKSEEEEIWRDPTDIMQELGI